MNTDKNKGEKFIVNWDGFGSYAYIKTGFSEEVHIYKVVRIIESNSYCEVPIQWNSEPKRHDYIVPVAEVIHCGIDESKIVRVAVSDCERIDDSDCEAYKEISGKLKEYEYLEEQGGLMKLPCKVQDIVYELCKCDDDTYEIFPMVVKDISPYGTLRQCKSGDCVWNIYAESDYTYMYKSFNDFGKTVFLTKSEAEQALKRMAGGINEIG